MRDVTKIARPLFVYASQSDPRVLRSESDAIVRALRTRGVPVEYMVAANEGYIVDRRETKVELHRTARFLKRRDQGHGEALRSEDQRKAGTNASPLLSPCLSTPSSRRRAAGYRNQVRAHVVPFTSAPHNEEPPERAAAILTREPRRVTCTASTWKPMTDGVFA